MGPHSATPLTGMRYPTRGPAGYLARWRSRRQMRHDLGVVTGYERSCVLRDLGLAASDIAPMLSAVGRDWQLPEMMHRLGLEPRAVEHGDPAVFRDMVRVCASCPAHRRCRRLLTRGEGVAGYRAFCRNVSTLDTLTQPLSSGRPQ